MYTSQFPEFRRQYPTACLSTDLLTIHEGLYVVRAQIHVDEKLVATGMAADGALEAAEDRACSRVLQRLGLTPISTEAVVPEAPNSPQVNALPSVSPSIPIPSALESPAPEPQPYQPLEQQESFFSSPEEEFISVDWEEEPELLTMTASPVVPSLENRDIVQSQPVAVPRRSNSKADGRTDAIAPTPAPTPLPIDQTTPKLSPLPSVNPPPVDLSDIIAQTDVELRRLGWTVAQGREFLEKTYGKRSRHDLTDQELLAFLLYLEMQPSP